ncbi:MAG TPA: class I SAM-dependent methyltransferase [Pseudomonadota bacterium]|nr:class I SAM-dependent methyltransferase [Pseudomonadota bacterium]
MKPNSASAAHYGDACADFYDRIHPMPATAMLHCLKSLAADGSACELGVGTGRTAAALVRLGVRVCGIESSPAMRAVMRARLGEQVPIIAGDFSIDALGGPHRLIFSLVDTLSLLPTRDAQQRCLHRVATHLEPGGRFVHHGCGGEFPDHETPRATRHRIVVDGRLRDYPVMLLDLSPSRLDAMAESAGLVRTHRCSDWLGTPWRPGSSDTVSIYRKMPTTTG